METGKSKILDTIKFSEMGKKHKVSFSNSWDEEKEVEYFRVRIMYEDWEFPVQALVAMANDEYPNGFVLPNADNPSDADYEALQADILAKGIVYFKQRPDGTKYQSVALAEESTTGFTNKRRSKVVDDESDVLPNEEKAADKSKNTAKTK